jgi:hypothetical protein
VTFYLNAADLARKINSWNNQYNYKTVYSSGLLRVISYYAVVMGFGQGRNSAVLIQLSWKSGSFQAELNSPRLLGRSWYRHIFCDQVSITKHQTNAFNGNCCRAPSELSFLSMYYVSKNGIENDWLNECPDWQGLF